MRDWRSHSIALPCIELSFGSCAASALVAGGTLEAHAPSLRHLARSCKTGVGSCTTELVELSSCQAATREASFEVTLQKPRQAPTNFHGRWQASLSFLRGLSFS